MLPLRSAPALALLQVALLASAAGAGSEWQAGDSGEGPGYAYQVFSEHREGEDFYRYEVRGRVEAAPGALSRAVRAITSDPGRAPEGQVRRILQTDDDEFIVYTRIDLPYPFGDRDIVTRGVRRAHGAGLRIDWEATEHPDAPPSEDAIRIERSAGHWTFVPGDGGSSEVVYHSYSDAAGSLPGWLVEPLTAKNVARVFEEVALEALGQSRSAMALP